MPLTDEQRQCREQILSEDYLDLIYTNQLVYNNTLENYGPFCRETVNSNYSIAHLDSSRAPFYSISTYGYEAIPTLYSLLDSSALEASGIPPAQLLPAPNLRGQGVLIGFIDTGIDYRNALFRKSDGTTRIAAIWDQTIQSENPPKGILYGTEYREEEINRALQSADSFSIVPSRDDNGHGTYIAGIAAGGESSDGSFSGAAPEATLLVVKCKPAKDNVKRYYFNEAENVFQSTDLMMGLRYLVNRADEFRLPLVICFSMGTNTGAHDGSSVIENLLTRLADEVGVVPVMAAGNEGNRQHHFHGQFRLEEPMQEVSIRIPENAPGFRTELWGDPSEIYSLSFRSPSGELFPRIPARLGQNQVLTSPLFGTRIYVDYTLTASRSGNLLISVGFEKPTSGIWTIVVYHEISSNGEFDIWLPIVDDPLPDTVFLRPEPDVTITTPGNAWGGITVSTWNHRNDSLYVYASRGYTRDGRIRPDIVAPGVELIGPAPGSRMTAFSGSSAAVAITSGAVASLLTWGITNRNDVTLGSASVRAYLIRGANRLNTYTYPNREWGFGTLNLIGVFGTLA